MQNCCTGAEIWYWLYDGSFVLKLGQLHAIYIVQHQNLLQIRYFHKDRGEPQEIFVQLASRRTFPVILNISLLFNSDISQNN